MTVNFSLTGKVALVAGASRTIEGYGTPAHAKLIDEFWKKPEKSTALDALFTHV